MMLELWSMAASGTKEDVELHELFTAILRRTGYDFHNYSPASIRRRVRNQIQAENCGSIGELREQVLSDAQSMERLLLALSVNISAMFRDPSFYRLFRTEVAPQLRTYPFLRIWHAGCSGGEEVYSLAILLREEGLYERTRIYATDMNDLPLQKAREGIFPLSLMKEYTANYQQAGGAASFSDYYTAQYDHAKFLSSLQENVVFGQHNLVTDGPFNEFHVILCRNVMIYFNKPLQEQVHQLLLRSLVRLGYLGLGASESLRQSSVESHYLALSQGLYRRVR